MDNFLKQFLKLKSFINFPYPFGIVLEYHPESFMVSITMVVHLSRIYTFYKAWTIEEIQKSREYLLDEFIEAAPKTLLKEINSHKSLHKGNLMREDK